MKFAELPKPDLAKEALIAVIERRGLTISWNREFHFECDGVPPNVRRPCFLGFRPLITFDAGSCVQTSDISVIHREPKLALEVLSLIEAYLGKEFTVAFA